MADTKVSALTPTTPVLTDLTYGVDDPGGTPASVSFTLQGIMDLFEANFEAPANFIDAITEISASLKTGADTTLVTGTAGTTDQIAVWNADGDIVGATAGTIAGLTAKATPASGDFLVLSDTADSGALKKVDLDNLPAVVSNDTTPTLGGDLDGAGNEVANYTNSVVTSVTGTLTTAAHAGNVIVTSGNVTVPTTAGFTCIIIAGGAHTVTFNSTTSAAMAAGDIMTVAVQSSTVIHAVLTAAADKVTFT